MMKLLIDLKEIDIFSLNKNNKTALFLASKGNILNKVLKLYQ